MKYVAFDNGTIKDANGKLVAIFDRESQVLHVDGISEAFSCSSDEQAFDIIASLNQQAVPAKKFKGYIVRWNWIRHPCRKDHQAHTKTLADARYWIKQALKEGSIYRDSIQVFFTNGTGSNTDVTGWAMQAIK